MSAISPTEGSAAMLTIAKKALVSLYLCGKVVSVKLATATKHLLAA